MAKSTIVISQDDSNDVKIEVLHEPLPRGTRDTWNAPAKLADQLIRMLLREGEKRGHKPKIEATLNSITGELDVITRKDKEDE